MNTRKDNANKHVWLRPTAKGRLQRVTNALQELYGKEWYARKWGNITASDTIEWLIYRTGMPGDRYRSSAYADNVWAEVFREMENRIFEED